MPPSLRPLSKWLDLLVTRQAMVAFAAVTLFETVMLLWSSFDVVLETFDGIQSGQLYVDHSSYPEGWIWSFVTFSCLQLFLGRQPGTGDAASAQARPWLWALLCLLTALGWTAAVALVALVAPSDPVNAHQFDYLIAENIAVSVVSVLILPVAVWQVSSLQPGQRLSLRASTQSLRPQLLAWTLNFVLLQIGLIVIGEGSERLAQAAFSGQPLWGYLVMILAYVLSLIGVALFPVAAYLSLEYRDVPAEVFS
jgi:uncharacterized membrane protein YbhN (UPF0104 family)